jgi:predicted nucleic acid-binding Zn ribbon protein
MSPDEPRPDNAEAAEVRDHDGGVPGPGGQEELDPMHAAHDALARARRGARQRGLRPGAPAGAGRRRAVGQPPPRDKDDRDPHLVGAEIERLVASRGWDTDVQVGAVIGRWSAIVGEQVAANVEVVAFEGTVLTVRAVSTAWATQMRLLASTILGRIEGEVGAGVVTEIVVRGPGGPSWRKGPLSSGGRGPRDTYG